MTNDVAISAIVGNSADTVDIFLSWATENFSEVNIVVQPENYDDTLELCTEWTEKCPQINMQIHEFENFSKQFQRSIDMCTKPWCLLMGSDEILVEFPYDKLPSIMDRVKKDVGIIPRYNLQRDMHHFNPQGYPDYQKRLIRTETGIGMNGLSVDESLDAPAESCFILEAAPIIHFGHVRPESALRDKGRMRSKFADDDPCDGPKLKVHGVDWFIVRNKEWDTKAQPLFTHYIPWIERYVPKDSPIRRQHED